MVLLRGLERPTDRGGYVSIGNFDGVHRGHRQIVQTLVDGACAERVPSVVLTFEPHPLQLLRPAHVPARLTTLTEKARLLEQAGVEIVLAYPTDRQLLNLTAEQFFEKVLIDESHVDGLVEGPNFCFGKDRKGDIETLRRLCEKHDIHLDILAPVGEASEMVSSSVIRAFLSEGRLSDAIALLGHPYRISGHVIEGARRGQTIGFPTANLGGIETLIPADGVYAGRLRIDDRPYRAAINIGPNPTFDETARKVEAHVLDFTGDLYGRVLDIDLVARLRDTRRFRGKDELIAQLKADVQATRDCAILTDDPL